MNKLILLLIAALAVLVMLLSSLSSIGQDAGEQWEKTQLALPDHDRRSTRIAFRATGTARYKELGLNPATETAQAIARPTHNARDRATRAVYAKNVDVDVQATQLHSGWQGTPHVEHGCNGGYHDAAHEAACDAYRAEFQARHGSPCRLIGRNWNCIHDEWTGPLPTSMPSSGGPAEPGGPTGPGDPIEPGSPIGPGGPTGPGDPIGPVHTIGEGLFDIDAAATALHQMVASPAATPAFRSICDLPPSGPAYAAACDLYKAAYRLKYGNPCRHNDEGEAVCLH